MTVVGLCTIKRRADFLRLRGGARWANSAFVLETKPRPDAREPGGPRFGFTVTKQLGGAVVRNRIRRRLKEAFRNVAVPVARTGHDYVVIARPPAGTLAFAELSSLVSEAMDRVHSSAARRGPRQPKAAVSGDL